MAASIERLRQTREPASGVSPPAVMASNNKGIQAPICAPNDGQVTDINTRSGAPISVFAVDSTDGLPQLDLSILG